MYLAEGIRIYSVYTVYIQGLYIQGKIQVNHNCTIEDACLVARLNGPGGVNDDGH